MSRRIKILIFDILAILICFLPFNIGKTSIVIPISIFISLLISLPILYFIIQNKPDDTSKSQKKIFRIIGSIFSILIEIPLLGFIIVFSPLVFCVIIIVSIHDVTGSSFFSYLVLIAIGIRVISELFWKIASSKKERKIQID